MIPCQECGNVNPLGTLFCHQCGAQLDLHLSQLQNSVNQTAAGKRSEAIFLAGKNAANLTMFLLITTIVFRFFLLPGHLPVGFPAVPPAPLEEIFPPTQQFSSTTGGSRINGGSGPITATPSEMLTASGEIELMKWRDHEKEVILGMTDVNLYTIANFQRRIAEQQNASDRLWHTGSDTLTATGLALLALQAYPQQEVNARLAKGLQAVKTLAISNSDSKSPGRILALLALLESGTLSRSETLTAVRICSSQPDFAKWCVFAQLSIPPSLRQDAMAILRSNVKDLLWLHVLEPFSDKPILEEISREVFTEAYATSLNAMDRIAWTNASWRLGIDLPVLKKMLIDWSAADPPLPAPEEISALAGADIAKYGLAVLAFTAPLRAPAAWLKDRKLTD